MNIKISSAHPIVAKDARDCPEKQWRRGRLILSILFHGIVLLLIGGHSLAADDIQKNSSSGLEPSKLQQLDAVSQYGITWKFSQKVPVGKFISGDFYVVGLVTIIAIDPKPLYGDEVPENERDKGEKDFLRNGFMLNPPAKQEMAYDSGMKNWYRAKLTQKLPVAMKPGDSLVSSISFFQKEKEVGFGETVGRHSSDGSPLKVSAVLTCVSEPQPPDAFRPSYCDRHAKIYLARDMKRKMLPSLATGDFKAKPDVALYIRWTQRSWINTGFFGFDRPSENMPGYGQPIAQLVEMCALILCTDLSPEKKEPLLINFVQVGIDLGGVIRAGHPGWEAFGGHGSGRKLPIVFAGLLLGDEALANINKTCPQAHFGEDEQTAYGDCWTGAKVVFTGHRAIDEATGIGRPKTGPYEHKPPEEWNGFLGPDRTGDRCSETYRRANTSGAWIGQALALHLLKAEKAWNHDAFFDYCDRWMYENDELPLARIGESYVKANQTEPNGGHATVDCGKKFLITRAHEFGSEGYVWDRLAGEMWANYRTMPGMPPTDGWKKPHDDSYYRNAITTADKK